MQAVLRATKTGGSAMVSRRQIVLMGAAATLVAASLPAVAAFGADAVKMFDTDNDGTLDLAEVRKAASNLFAKLDRDHDGTLDKRELAGRLSAKGLAAADPDRDGRLTLDEYFTGVGRAFNHPNTDKDGTSEGQELRA